MRLTTGKIALVAVGLIVLLVALLVLLGDGGDSAEPNSAVSPPPATETVPSESETSPPPPEVTAEEEARLKDRSIGFFEDYYLIKPEDTEISRQARVERFVYTQGADAVLDQIDFSLASGTSADESRIQNRLTISAEVAFADMVVDRAYDDSAVWVVGASVDIIVRNSEGSEISRIRSSTASRWFLHSNEWYLIAFEPGGEVE